MKLLTKFRVLEVAPVSGIESVLKVRLLAEGDSEPFTLGPKTFIPDGDSPRMVTVLMDKGAPQKPLERGQFLYAELSDSRPEEPADIAYCDVCQHAMCLHLPNGDCGCGMLCGEKQAQSQVAKGP